MATQTYIIPTIGTKGRFTFKKPFDNEKYNGKEYQVSAIRNLKELQDSGEKPYDAIYQIMSISQTDFEDDLNSGVPILVLSDLAGKYLYVPADLVQGMPDITGVKYQEIILAASLGLVPYTTDTESLKDLKEAMVEVITERFGINTTIEEVRGSAIKFIDESEHKKYQRLLNKNKANKYTYKARYKTLNNSYNDLQLKYNELEKYVISKIQDGTIPNTDFEINTTTAP